MPKSTKLVLTLSKDHQKEYGYQNRNFEWTLEDIALMDQVHFDLDNIDPQEVRDYLASTMWRPKGFFDDYKVIVYRGMLMVNKDII